jgi:nicotinamidase-related amidase
MSVTRRELSFTCRHFVSAPAERYGVHEEVLRTPVDQTALLLVNVYGLLLPAEHPSRRAQVEVYGEAQVARREMLVEENLLPAIRAARAVGMPVVYVSDSAPNIGLETSNIRDVVRRHLNIDPLLAFAEARNDPLEYLPGTGQWIAYAPELDPLPCDYYVRKWVYSGFHGTWLDRLLRNLGTKTLFCAGFNGDSDLFCTMMEGHWAGYRVVLLRGCHAAVHVAAYEPETGFTERLEIYAEGSLGFTISVADFGAACVSEDATHPVCGGR